MTDPRWTRLWEVFHDALEIAADERNAFIVSAAGDDSELRAQVLQLLESHEKAGSFIEPPARPSQHNPREPIPAWIGRYRVVRLLGEGGFAEVFLGEQTEPIRRQVAIKVLKPGLDSRRILARFEAERQMLAFLDHPGIAKVFDAGISESGRPYFIMEFIDGEPVTEFASTHNLSLRQRLELFMQVCAAVQHAHHKGIVHRDLKPGNVLVVREQVPIATPVRDSHDAANQVPAPDARPEFRPKVIDFGVARAMALDTSLQTRMTEAGQFIGTPEYMSPEQAEGRPDDLDTRTDVYALGVILYELLTGSLPFDASTLRGAAFAEILRIIREQDPQRPSERVGSLHFVPSRSTNSSSMIASVRDLRGDLDWIVMKTLEKDRARRYDSPSALAADILRHLEDQPVLAGPPSVSYQFAKFVRRNRTSVALSALALLVLLLGAAATAWQAVRATRSEHNAQALALSERDLRIIADERSMEAEHQKKIADERLIEVERQKKIAESVNEFLNRDVLRAADPRRAPNPNITMREVIDAAADRLGEDRFKNDPLVEASIRRVIGDTYRSMGVYDRALIHMERARELFKQHAGPEDPLTLGAVNDLAIVYRTMGRYADAEPLLREGIEIRTRMLGENHRETYAARINLGALYRSLARLEDSEAMLRECVDGLTLLQGANDADTVLARQHLATTYHMMQRWSDAEPLFRSTYENQRKALGEDHPYTVASMSSLAHSLFKLGRMDEAGPLYEQTVQACTRRLGRRHSDTGTALCGQGFFLRDMKKYEEAEKLFIEALDIHRQTLGPEHPQTLETVNGLGTVYDHWDRFADAEPLYAEAVRIGKQRLPAQSLPRATYIINYGCCLEQLNRLDEAEVILKEGLASAQAIVGEDHEQTRRACGYLSSLYKKRGDEAQAIDYGKRSLGTPKYAN